VDCKQRQDVTSPTSSVGENRPSSLAMVPVAICVSAAQEGADRIAHRNREGS
jgi:hypothetical protein